jgi:hypothetical protein
MLKYLFIVTYKDRTVFKQTKEDVSKLDPKRSCFYDVTLKLKEVKTFEIIEQSLFPKKYSIDLESGLFNINGNVINVGEEVAGPKKLIYFRRHRQSTNVTYELTSGNVVKNLPIGDEVMYIIGWEGKDEKGKNIKRIIGV